MHLAYVAEALERAERGEVDYLVVVHEQRLVSIGGADYAARAGAATLWQLATDPACQSRGFGTVLVRALEEAAGARGISTARLLVEEENARAIALYRRLGYVATGVRQRESWNEPGPDGTVRTYTADCLEFARTLSFAQA